MLPAQILTESKEYEFPQVPKTRENYHEVSSVTNNNINKKMWGLLLKEYVINTAENNKTE